MGANKLDLDFIGGQDPLTKIEEKQISDYFKNRNLSKRTVIKKRTASINSTHVGV
jgi:hypothetical protein